MVDNSTGFGLTDQSDRYINNHSLIGVDDDEVNMLNDLSNRIALNRLRQSQL